uniref:Uncharacterized protein n=1 Tax=Romanomermis culicivorax TaxID=13658 RepID=A0A915HPB1_ROMCU
MSAKVRHNLNLPDIGENAVHGQQGIKLSKLICLPLARLCLPFAYIDPFEMNRYNAGIFCKNPQWRKGVFKYRILKCMLLSLIRIGSILNYCVADGRPCHLIDNTGWPNMQYGQPYRLADYAGWPSG